MLKHNDWFIPFKQEKNAYIRLFCFHYGGGSASTFRRWSKDLIDELFNYLDVKNGSMNLY